MLSSLSYSQGFVNNFSPNISYIKSSGNTGSIDNIKSIVQSFADNLVKASVFYDLSSNISSDIGITNIVGNAYGTDNNGTNIVTSNYFGGPSSGEVIMQQNLFDTDTYIFATIKNTGITGRPNTTPINQISRVIPLMDETSGTLDVSTNSIIGYDASVNITVTDTNTGTLLGVTGITTGDTNYSLNGWTAILDPGTTQPYWKQEIAMYQYGSTGNTAEPNSMFNYYYPDILGIPPDYAKLSALSVKTSELLSPNFLCTPNYIDVDPSNNQFNIRGDTSTSNIGAFLSGQTGTQTGTMNSQYNYPLDISFNVDSSYYAGNISNPAFGLYLYGQTGVAGGINTYTQTSINGGTGIFYKGVTGSNGNIGLTECAQLLPGDSGFNLGDTSFNGYFNADVLNGRMPYNYTWNVATTTIGDGYTYTDIDSTKYSGNDSSTGNTGLFMNVGQTGPVTSSIKENAKYMQFMDNASTSSHYLTIINGSVDLDSTTYCTVDTHAKTERLSKNYYEKSSFLYIANSGVTGVPKSAEMSESSNIKGSRTWVPTTKTNQFDVNNAFNSVDVVLGSDNLTDSIHTSNLDNATNDGNDIMKTKYVYYDISCVSGSSNWYNTYNNNSCVAAWNPTEGATSISSSSIVLDCLDNSIRQGSSTESGIYFTQAMSDGSMNTYDNFQITLTPTNVYAYNGVTGITGINVSGFIGITGITGITGTNANNVWAVTNPEGYAKDTTVVIGGISGSIVFNDSGLTGDASLGITSITGLNATVYGTGSQSQFPENFALRITPKCPATIRNGTTTSGFPSNSGWSWANQTTRLDTSAQALVHNIFRDMTEGKLPTSGSIASIDMSPYYDTARDAFYMKLIPKIGSNTGNAMYASLPTPIQDSDHNDNIITYTFKDGPAKSTVSFKLPMGAYSNLTVTLPMFSATITHTGGESEVISSDSYNYYYGDNATSGPQVVLVTYTLSNTFSELYTHEAQLVTSSPDMAISYNTEYSSNSSFTDIDLWHNGYYNTTSINLINGSENITAVVKWDTTAFIKLLGNQIMFVDLMNTQTIFNITSATAINSLNSTSVNISDKIATYVILNDVDRDISTINLQFTDSTILGSTASGSICQINYNRFELPSSSIVVYWQPKTIFRVKCNNNTTGTIAGSTAISSNSNSGNAAGYVVSTSDIRASDAYVMIDQGVYVHFNDTIMNNNTSSATFNLWNDFMSYDDATCGKTSTSDISNNQLFVLGYGMQHGNSGTTGTANVSLSNLTFTAGTGLDGTLQQPLVMKKYRGNKGDSTIANYTYITANRTVTTGTFSICANGTARPAGTTYHDIYNMGQLQVGFDNNNQITMSDHNSNEGDVSNPIGLQLNMAASILASGCQTIYYIILSCDNYTVTATGMGLSGNTAAYDNKSYTQYATNGYAGIIGYDGENSWAATSSTNIYVKSIYSNTTLSYKVQPYLPPATLTYWSNDANQPVKSDESIGTNTSLTTLYNNLSTSTAPTVSSNPTKWVYTESTDDNTYKIPNTFIQLTRNTMSATNSKKLYLLPKGGAYKFQFQDNQLKFTTCDVSQNQVVAYVPFSKVASNTYNPFANDSYANKWVNGTVTFDSALVNNTTFTCNSYNVMQSSNNYWNYITQQSPTFFPLHSLNIKLEQTTPGLTKTIYDNSLEKLIHNDGITGNYSLSTVVTHLSSTTNDYSGNISLRFLQDYLSFNSLTNLNNYTILDIPTLILPNTDSNNSAWSQIPVYTSESIQMVALGTNIVRDPSFGFPTAVNAVMYVTPNINAAINQNTYINDTLSRPNQIATTSIPFSKKYVKTYPITYEDNTTNSYNLNIYDVISHTPSQRNSGVCVNSGAWNDMTNDLTNPYVNAITDLQLTPLKNSGLYKIKSLFNPSTDNSDSNIPQNPAQLNMYVSISKPMLVTVDAANNQISQVTADGNLSGTSVSVHF